MPPVKVGVTLKMYGYGSYAPKTLAEIAGQARSAEELGFDSVWVMDHVFIQRPGGRVLAHDPMICLGAVAAATDRIKLGTLVLGHAFRHVGQLAREASALADASAGRFVLGIGSGWHRSEFDALGLPFDHRVARLEEAVGPLQQMLRGQRAEIRGTWLQLHDASIAVTTQPPPIWIAAEGPRMLALAARADGWNHAYWGAGDTTRFKSALAGLRLALESAGRQAHEVETSATIACVIDGWNAVPGGFSEPEVAVGPVERIAELVKAYADAGAQHVILSLSPDPYAEIDPAALEKAARVLELM
ncbi:MAG TPA: LLM class flavin-dependent oxidoreductase [Candidatus Baltobacterales bacterium]|nr:LLM class flavin-dependent oxidoreductase [Candidatus Baltobacterales bacterium]